MSKLVSQNHTSNVVGSEKRDTMDKDLWKMFNILVFSWGRVCPRIIQPPGTFFIGVKKRLKGL